MANYIVMGVSGCGKSVVGAALAAALDARFLDGDDLHPPGNIAKMAAGTPLNDQDRAPWLARVGASFAQGPGDLVIACSALKRAYRDQIRGAAKGPVRFVHLHGQKQIIQRRISARQEHFMPPALLDSQLAALEPLAADESGVLVDIDRPVQEIVAAIVAKLKAQNPEMKRPAS